MFFIKLIGIRIAKHRKKKKLSLTELASGIISVSYLSNIEHGRKIPSIETLMHLADSLDIHAKELILDEETLHTEKLSQLFEIVFNYIVTDDFVLAQELLIHINQSYRLSFESSEMELCYYLLLATIALKKWQFSEFEAIQKSHFAVLNTRTFSANTTIYYLYLQAVEENLAMNYPQSIKHLNALLERPTLSLEATLQIKLYLVITTICDSQYEEAIQVAEDLISQIDQLDPAYHDRKIPANYLLGFAYYHIDFFNFAKNHLTLAADLLPTSPKMSKNYRMVILHWLSLTTAKLQDFDGIPDINNQMYQLFVTAFKGKEELAKNDYLPLADLLIYYGESNDLQRAKQILKWFQHVAELPNDLYFHLEYGKALIAYYEDDTALFEHSLRSLFNRLDQCNNPVLLDKIKKSLSQFYAQNKKYKLSYRVISDDL